MPRTARELRRYSLALPEDMFAQLEETARNRGMTVVELLKTFIKIGFLVIQVDENDNAALIIREGDKEREVVLVS
ncbi:MAG TPA: hypothetical protein VGE45_20595 [Chloroflexia bacterium]